MGLTVESTSRHTLQLRGTNMDLTDMSQETAQRIWDASTPVQKEDGQFYCKHEGCTFRHEYACNTRRHALWCLHKGKALLSRRVRVGALCELATGKKQRVKRDPQKQNRPRLHEIHRIQTALDDANLVAQEVQGGWKCSFPGFCAARDNGHKVYQYKKSCDRHMAEEHANLSRILCPVQGCQCSFTRKQSLDTHLFTQHGKDTVTPQFREKFTKVHWKRERMADARLTERLFEQIVQKRSMDESLDLIDKIKRFKYTPFDEDTKSDTSNMPADVHDGTESAFAVFMSDDIDTTDTSNATDDKHLIADISTQGHMIESLPYDRGTVTFDNQAVSVL